MDLSKAYDCLPHDLNIAKFEACGFDNISSKLFHSYFSNRKQRVKIGSAKSGWMDILTEIPQGSIVGSLIFSIFINDLIMFMEKTGICSFADDNTLHKSSPNLPVVLNWLGHQITIVLSRFKVNSLKANPQKFQFMFSIGKKTLQYKCSIEDNYIFPDIQLSF